MLSREEASTVEHVEERARGKGGGGGARAAGGANTKKPSTLPIVRQAQERREAARDVLAVPNSICRRGRLLPISPIADECVFSLPASTLRFEFLGKFPACDVLSPKFIYSAWMALLITRAQRAECIVFDIDAGDTRIVQHILCSIEFFHHEHAQHQR